MDVEAVEYFLLPLPAPYKISRHRVCFRFHKNLTASAFTSLTQCFMKNASASGSSKNQILPSLLPLPASFFNVLPLPPLQHP